MGGLDITVERLRRYAVGLGVDDLALRLIALTVWTDSVERTAKEKVAEIRRRLMRAAWAAGPPKNDESPGAEAPGRLADDVG